MKTLRSCLALPLVLLGFAASAPAQTIITSVPYTISASGKYTLSGNLNSSSATVPAITVSAPNVILDLNGYYVAGPGNPALGNSMNSVIYVGDVANTVVRNGTLAGNAYGIYYAATTTATSRNYVVDTVTFTRCYIGGVHFSTSSAPGSQVKNCSFSIIGSSTVASAELISAIYTLGGVRIENNNIGDVTALGSATSYGISADDGDFIIGNTISNCTYGVDFGKYQNNLTAADTVVYPFADGIDAGGNN